MRTTMMERLSSGVLTGVAIAFAATGIAAPAAVAQDAPPTIASILPENGDPGGRRKALAERGIAYGLNYIGEVQSNVTGGLNRGTIYIGRLEAFTDWDLGKLAGMPGLTFHANVFNIQGSRLSADHIGNVLTASYIEALPTTRLAEAWLEQKLVNDTLSIRAGQMDANAEFFTSGYAAQFINTTFGWPAMMGTAMPSGGPSYPLSAPGVRVKLDPNKNFTVLAGLFNGDPAGPGTNLPEERNRYGLNFRMQDPALLMGELHYRYNQDKGAAGLAGTIKLGAWTNVGHFDDQRFDAFGRSLADPAGTGIASKHRGNSALYGIIDQQIWRPASGEPDKGVGVFARVQTAPSDRNLIDLYLDGGIVFSGMIPGRPDDIVSLGGAYARVSNAARALDADTIAFTGKAQPLRDYEAALELNYQAQIAAGLQVDLDVQHIWHPGLNVQDPALANGSAIADATVLTLHTSIKY